MIPEYLFSDGNGCPFEQCTICEEKLENQLYFIEKSMGKYAGTGEVYTRFEYAICGFCKDAMMQKISKESKAHIMELAQKSDVAMPKMLSGEECSTTAPLHCTATGKLLQESEGYQIVATVNGGELLFEPMAFSEDFIEGYQEILSDETKDFFDDFGKNITDLPPSLAKLFNKNHKPIIL